MHLSLFALFFALPAAYAAVRPQQRSEEAACVPAGDPPTCTDNSDCLTSLFVPLECYTTSSGGTGVCLMAHLLLFTLLTELNAVLPA
jgi:hypothetical protein